MSTRLDELKELLTRLERQANRFGELWERCQGKGWPDAEAKEFTIIRDERIPKLKAKILELYEKNLPKPAEYQGVRCACIVTKCRPGPGCPLYSSYCAAHIQHEATK